MNQNLKHFSSIKLIYKFRWHCGLGVDIALYHTEMCIYLFTGSQGQKKGGRSTKQIKQNPMNWTELLPPPPPVNPPPCQEYSLALDDR